MQMNTRKYHAGRDHQVSTVALFVKGYRPMKFETLVFQDGKEVDGIRSRSLRQARKAHRHFCRKYNVPIEGT